MATLERVLQDVRRIEEIDSAINGLHQQTDIHKTQQTRDRLKPLSDEFDSYSYIGSLVPESIAYKTYDSVKGNLGRITQQLDRLSKIKVNATLIVGMPTDGPNESFGVGVLPGCAWR